MKKNLHLIILAVGIGTLCISGIAGVMYPDGSPGAKTGSPLDGTTCAQCHVGNVTEASWITSNIPETGWEPGETYTLTLTATPESAEVIGFEVTAEADNKKVGTFILNEKDRTRFTNNNKSVTHDHNGISITNGQNSWKVDWKAPDNNLSSVTFYAAFNAANGDGTTMGDHIYASSISYDVNNGTAIDLEKQKSVKIYPNPASNFVNIQADTRLISVELFNANGRLVKSLNYSKTIQNQISTSDLDRGFYLLKAKTEKGEFKQRLLLK